MPNWPRNSCREKPSSSRLELRPMVGIGYAFISADTAGDINRPSNTQVTTATGTAAASGIDIAPGAKFSYVARALEVYTLPKYHFISGNNFFGVEVGAGARF